VDVIEMKITQTKEMSKEVFLSLSDEVKIKMTRQQFFFSLNDLKTLYPWLHEITDVFYLEQTKDRMFVLFLSEEDATAFKLTWM